ncbi:hypothetical protein LOTGIDRAFT_157604 [Lottia gigantea]|uniref:Uncharacterized protein n=1 Tax=Lottia gigantea TaxID=225164 RepID=V4B1Y6_LOTGI|nr:hypothetical protein LOTGIDRAFT_157604 [Lottia gigantea]ESP01421.1 hypothetical protein LOTGIDRAFT_157604 [Lottia gigantea]
MTTFQNLPRNPVYNGVPPSLLRKTFQPVVYDSDLRFDHQIMDKFVDDDDFSDHDSHYSEDLEDDFRFQLLNCPSGTNMTKQLLNFADLVNNDIKKFFGPKKGSDDTCDIYADKWKTIKSGRERYYRDLLRIAEGDNDLSKNGKDNSEYNQKIVDNRHTFSGRLDERLGLGPLKELFDRGLHGTNSERKTRTGRASKYESVPMHQRRFPDSFWRPPSNVTKRYPLYIPNTHVQNSPKPPDFSDLLETWTMAADSEFNADFSSDVNSPVESFVHRRL